MNIWKNIRRTLAGLFRQNPGGRCEKLVIEIPDALDPTLADEKYTQPLRAILSETGIGSISAVNQGQSNTPDEYSRFITVKLCKSARDIENVLNVISNFLFEKGSPAGTFIHTYDQAENKLDSYLAKPDAN